MNARHIGCLKFIFYQKYFYDKMDWRLFYFHVIQSLSFLRKPTDFVKCSVKFTCVGFLQSYGSIMASFSIQYGRKLDHIQITYPRFFGTSLPGSFSVWFLNFIVAFTSWDIGWYVYCNCLLTRLWNHKFWN